MISFFTHNGLTIFQLLPFSHPLYPKQYFSYVTFQLALFGLAEFVFHLVHLDADMFHIACNTGCLTQTFFTFEINTQGRQYKS